MPKKTFEKKHVYKVGDIVRIKNPVFVQRVGYPWTKEYVKRNVITEEQKKAIDDLLVKFGLKWDKTQIDEIATLVEGKDEQCYEDILNRLAYYVLRNKQFGGKERTLHTELVEEYRDKPAKVISKRRVKTGIYCTASGGYDYDYGGYEYVPPYLEEEKTHIILSLEIYTDDNMWDLMKTPNEKNSMFDRQYLFLTDIDECNVEAVKVLKNE